MATNAWQKEPKTFFIKTYGCQMNERDSETIAGILQARGMAEVSVMAAADLVMVNTCTVRDKAEQKVYGLLGRLRELKEQKPDLILGICGCMTQQQAVAKHIRSRYPFMDIIIGTHNLASLGSYLDQVLQNRRQILAVWEQRSAAELELPARRSGKFKAFVNINWGCNNYCTYCIVPYVRGREKSRPLAAVLNEVAALAQAGFKEITLLGQNVNSYGKDLPAQPDFADLLGVVAAVCGIERIRFMTSHPRDVSERLLTAFAGLPKVCNHLHLPLQAGSDRLLRKMNRGYTAEHYLAIVARLRQLVPSVALTTDIIVGFPGETEADFAATMAIVRQVRFDSAYTFMYSPRQGTPAAAMEQAPAAVKKQRLQQLIKLQNSISLELNRELEGTIQPVLVENAAEGIARGRTTTGKLVYFETASDLSGHIVPVTITAAKTWSLLGELR